MSDSTALSDFIDILIEYVSANGLWNVILSLVPFIGITVLFGMGVYFVIRMIMRTLQGRGGL